MNESSRLNRSRRAWRGGGKSLLPALALVLLATAFTAGTTGLALAQGKSDQAQKNRNWNLRREERLIDYRDERGRVRPELWMQGIEQFREMNIAAGVYRPGMALSEAPAAGSGLQGVQWIQVGPQPAFPIEGVSFQGNGAMSGEVLDIAIDPRNTFDRVIYSVTNDGGVWRSMDGGVTFEPKTDNMPSLSMGAIVLDPANPSIVYAGTGNLFDGNGSTTTLAVKAVGIYRSIDMGESWSMVNPDGLFNGVGIARMAMPAADVLLVATPNGLYKSVNGGMTFGQAPTYDNGQPVRSGNVEDIDLDTVDPVNVMYASVNGQGIFVSTDGGDTFTANLFTNANGSPIDDFGAGSFAFLRMAQGRSDPDRMYANVQESGVNPDGDADGFLGLYRSDDGGSTWTRMPAADVPGADNGGCQCGYDQTVGVDPRDEDRVYIGFQELYFSPDGGASFGAPAISRNKIHWDHHYIGWSPPTHWGGLEDDDPTPMWVGTDGGIHSTDDGGVTFNNFHNATIASNLFHHIDIGRGSAANNDWTYGGTQDTGTLHSCAPAGACGAAALASGDVPWEMGNNGDGSGIAVDPTNPLRAYGVRNGGYRFTDDGGQTWQNPAAGPAIPTGAWRYAIDANDTTRVWLATGGTFSPTNALWRSNDGSGTNWSLVTTFGTNIRDLALVAVDSNVLWLGMTDGTLRRSTNATDASPSFTTISVPGNPGTSVSEVAINPLNPDDVVVTYRGLCGAPCNNSDNRMKRIFRTTNAGTTWNDISGTDGNPVGNLPNLPTHSVVFDIGTSPISIVVANDAGVLRSSNNGQTWERLGLGLPTADSKMLQIDDSVEPPLLRLGTYGRSIWELAEAQGPILAVNADLGFDTVCIGERQTRVVQLFNVGSDPLTVTAIFRLSGSTQLRVLAAPSTPFDILPGEQVNFTVEFLASVPGDHTAIFQINSNDQFEPSFQIPASGTVNTEMIATVIAAGGDFGNVCTNNAFRDLNLTIANPGCGMLEVSNIAFAGGDAADFRVPGVLNYPLQIAAGNSLAVPIRFDPASGCGSTRSTIVRISSSDPDNPTKDVPVSGFVPCPNLEIDASSLSGLFAFPATVVDGDGSLGCYSDRSTNLRNTGLCPLTISGISATGDDFTVIAPTQFPIVLPPGEETLGVTVRFTPQDGGDPLAPDEITGTLTVVSDDPDASGEAELCGEGVVQSGLRMLVSDVSSGVPLAVDAVDSITLRSKGKSTPGPINLSFADKPVEGPVSICGNAVSWHLNLETLPATETTGSQGGKSQYELNAKEANLQDSRTFSLGQCAFREFQMQLQDSGSEICLLKPKGESCNFADECCSGKCTGKPDAKTCN